MRAVVKREPGRGATYVDNWPDPACGPGQIRLAIAASSICGTDRELYEYGPSAQAFGLAFPVVLGHECSGTVIETGRGVTAFDVGDRVALESHIPCWRCFACRTGHPHNCQSLKILGMHTDGTFAERTVVPAEICFTLPDSITFENAALLEPAGVAMHALQRTGVCIGGRNVLISGCGPVGLVLTQLCAVMGASNLLVIEPNAGRAELARHAGARVVAPGAEAVELCRSLGGTRGGFDVAFEASGAENALQTLLDGLRREAHLVTIGHPGRPAEIDVAAYINKKGIVLAGVFGRRLWDTWESLMSLIDARHFDPGSLITHRLPLNQFEHALDLLSDNACKIILRPDWEAA